MASGLPIIAAKSGPTMEQVSHEVNGMLYENEDLDSLLDAVEVIDDEEKFNNIKEEARKEALKFSWDNASKRLLDYYKDARDHHSVGRS